MKRLILILLFCLGPLSLMSHNPLSAMYRFVGDENGGILTIALSEVGVNKTLVDIYGAEKIEGMDRTALKERIAAYIKANFHFEINGEVVRLMDGGIRLGSHQIDLKFVTGPIARDVNSMTIAIKAFKENEKHQTVFSYQTNSEKNTLILDRNNDYSQTLSFGENDNQLYAKGLFIVLGGVALLMSGILIQRRLFLKNKKKKRVVKLVKV